LTWKLVYGPPWDDGGFFWSIQDDMAVVWEELAKTGINVSISELVTLVIRGFGLGFLDAMLGVVSTISASVYATHTNII